MELTSRAAAREARVEATGSGVLYARSRSVSRSHASARIEALECIAGAHGRCDEDRAPAASTRSRNLPTVIYARSRARRSRFLYQRCLQRSSRDARTANDPPHGMPSRLAEQVMIDKADTPARARSAESSITLEAATPASSDAENTSRCPRREIYDRIAFAASQFSEFDQLRMARALRRHEGYQYAAATCASRALRNAYSPRSATCSRAPQPPS